MAIEKQYTITVSTKQAQANIDELNASFNLQELYIEGVEEELRKYERQLLKTSKTDLAARESINKKIADTKTLLADEKLGLKKLNKERKEANDILKEAEEQAGDYSGIIGTLDKQTGGLISGTKAFKTSLKGVVKGLKTMRGAVIATGLGALVVILGSLIAAFTSSEEGQNKWAKAMAMVGAVVGVFTDLLADLGGLLISVFTDPVKALKSFGNSIKTYVMDSFDKIMDSVGLLGSAIKKLFKGDFSGAFEDAKKGAGGLVSELIPAVKLIDAAIDGTVALTKATKKLALQVAENAKKAGIIADQRAKADKLERDLIVERAEATKVRAELLSKAIDKENFDLKQRIGFLKEAGVTEDAIVAKQVEAAKLRLDAKIAENKMGKSNKEDLEEEATLRANLINLETEKLLKAREVTSQIIGLNAEAAAAKTAKDAQEIADAKAIQDFKDGLRIKDKENKFADIEAEREQRIKALEELKLSKTEEQQMLLDVEQAFKEKKKIIEAEEKVIADEKLAAFMEKEIEQKDITLEEEKNDALAKAKRLGASKEDMFQIESKYIKLQKDAEDQAEAAKVQMAKVGFGKMADILGKNSKAGKAAAAAAALINTYQGITAELATKTVTPFGFAMKLVNIASVAAIGFKSVKSILATNTESGGGGATNPASGAATASAEALPPQAPAFNVVGASETNQLADAIGGQAQQPVQAFVVSGDVTTAQSLERNIIQGATIG